MTTEKEILDLMHTNIHALRLMKGYKPTDFELRINKIISGYYATTCAECKQRVEGHINLPQQNGNNNDSGFLGKLGKWANGAYENAKEIE